MDIECGGFTFVSNFDSGNLARVELVPKKQNVNPNIGKNSPAEEIPDFEFNIWTKPDCAGTEFENSNRTWFYFGIKGGSPFALVKLNIVNLNRQSKMYSQGMAPVFRIVPGRNHWDRIKEKPSYTVEDDVFILSFKYRTLENIRATTYFAFTFPYSYLELQNMLNSLDGRFKNISGECHTPNSLDDIYYHRECVCHSLEGRLIDLVTISSYHNISTERETRLKHLFPVSTVPRPFRFYGKKVVFVSARVHPGETPSSFVLNGLLNLLLARDDPVSILLRKMYVFKLIPMLNPDGVSQGHYRTDTRGVNLNRMYLNPIFELHPSVFAARSLVRYYHHGQEIEEECINSGIPNTNYERSVCEFEKLKCVGGNIESSLESLESEKQDFNKNNQLSDINRISNIENKVSDLSLNEKQSESPQCLSSVVSPTYNIAESTLQNNNVMLSNSVLQEKKDVFSVIHDSLLNVMGDTGNNISDSSSNTISVVGEGLSDKPLLLKNILSVVDVSTIPLYRSKMDENSVDIKISNNVVNYDDNLPDDVASICKKASSADHSIGSSSGVASVDMCSEEEHQANELRKPTAEKTEANPDKPGRGLTNLVINNNNNNITATPQESGIYLYVDLHGHASKKGIFMYGNYFEDVEDSIECMLLPKIMSLNSQNFHFTACNFTERNMYLRDRRDGMSREGSGRVAVLKTTGLVRSYTLECNYNTGRLVNVLPPCVKENKNFSSATLMVPPKYTPQVFEEVGRALGVSILDLTGSNPWSRIPHSEFHTLSGIRDWLRINCLPEQTYIKMMQGQKQIKRQSCNMQHYFMKVREENASEKIEIADGQKLDVEVGGMTGMSVGMPTHPMRPSSSKSRLSSSKRDMNFVRTRRLAPLLTKSSESKIGPMKVPSSTHIGILCRTDLKSAKSGVENVVDSERKENLSSFQVGSCSQSSCVKITKVFPGPCSSQRCPGTSKKLKSVQNSSSGVLKQVLAVRSKCVGALASGSKTTKNNLSPGRIPALGNVSLVKKGAPLPSPTRIAKFRKSSIVRLSSGAIQEEYKEYNCLKDTGIKGSSECDVGKKGLNQGGIGNVNSIKSGSSVDKVKCVKDEQKNLSDQTVVKQGSKRLKISPFKIENNSGNMSLPEVSYKSEGVLISRVKLKEINLVKMPVRKEKKLFSKNEKNSKLMDFGINAQSQNLSEGGWDSNQDAQDVSLGASYQNSPKLRTTRKKPLPQNSNVKPITPVTRASISDSQGTGTGNKVKYSTKSEKQGKGKIPHLSPFKTLQKNKSIDSGRKRGKVSLRSLATTVGRFRVPSSEANQSVHLEKKRKKCKSKFL